MRCAPAALISLTLGAPLAAQTNLRELPTADRMVTVGTTSSGTLGRGDATLPNGAYAQAWRLAAAGLSVTVDLRSDDFDAYLYMVGPDSLEITDDDSGGGCHARIAHRLLPGDEYRIVVSSVSPRTTGDFTLSVAEEPVPPDPSPCDPGLPGEVRDVLDGLTPVGELRPGDEIHGALTTGDQRAGDEGPYVQAWELVARAGEEITLDLISDAFDAFLLIVGPDLSMPLMDDDCAGGTNASLAVVLTADSGYRVVATSYAPGEVGTFTLVASRGSTQRTLDCRARVDAEDANMEALFDGFPDLGPAGTLSLGAELHDTLPGTEGETANARAWEFSLQAGETVTVDARSDAFDAFLVISGPGLGEPLRDDDGGGACHARVTFAASASGTYRAVVTSLFSVAGGPFTLRLLREPPLPDPTPCDG